jgi:hypothetical protein
MSDIEQVKCENEERYAYLGLTVLGVMFSIVVISSLLEAM